MPIINLTVDDLREAAQSKLDKKYAITDRMFSMLTRTSLHLSKDELKEAIETQNELLLLLISETRKLS